MKSDDTLARLHVVVSLDLPTTYDILDTISDAIKVLNQFILFNANPQTPIRARLTVPHELGL
jgi:hypothetical protein